MVLRHRLGRSADGGHQRPVRGTLGELVAGGSVTRTLSCPQHVFYLGVPSGQTLTKQSPGPPYSDAFWHLGPLCPVAGGRLWSRGLGCRGKERQPCDSFLFSGSDENLRISALWPTQDANGCEGLDLPDGAVARSSVWERPFALVHSRHVGLERSPSSSYIPASTVVQIPQKLHMYRATFQSHSQEFTQRK